MTSAALVHSQNVDRAPTTQHTYARPLMMDTLRSLPQSLSAARTSLRHVLAFSNPISEPGSRSPAGRQDAQPVGIHDEWICVGAITYGRAPKQDLKCCGTPAPGPSTTTAFLPKTAMVPLPPTNKYIGHPHALYIP
ncbi:hypothetical protein RSAG8_00599, partial [Rhizoctonia solani AG-8 WAC10335]